MCLFKPITFISQVLFKSLTIWSTYLNLTVLVLLIHGDQSLLLMVVEEYFGSLLSQHRHPLKCFEW